MSGRVASYQRLGLYHQAIEALRGALRSEPTNVSLRRQLISLLRNASDAEAILEALQTDGRRWRLDPDLAFLKARLLSQLRRRRDAVAAIEGALETDPGPEGTMTAAALYLELGDVEAARRLYRKARRQRPKDPRPVVALSTLNLWSLDLGAVLRGARTAERLGASPESTARLRGAAAVLRGVPAEAIEELTLAATRSPGDYEALVWRSEAHRRLGDHDTAEQDASRARALSTSYLVVAELDEQLARLDGYVARGHAELRPDAYAGLLDKLGPLLPASMRHRRHSIATLRRAYEHALAGLGGNRTTNPVRAVTRGGTVTLGRWDPPGDPRAEARAIQMLIRARPPADVLTRLAELERREPATPTIACHTGEVHLWLGEYGDAERAFQRALRLDISTRWAYIGLAAVRLLQGDARGCLAECDRGATACPPPPGRTMFTYRGEARRALGDLAGALDDFSEAVRLDPGRLSARIDLALTRTLARVDLQAARSMVEGLPPGLAQAATEASDARQPVAILETCLRMMRGNRSTALVTYFDREGRMRFV